jgi:pimeloyl-ACP methyl ester carboxylesterase
MTAPPVLLIHGFASSFDHGWRRHGWIDLLADEGRCALHYDLPGHGQRVGAMVHEYEDISNQLWEIVADTQPIDIVGFSAGARIALRMAILQPKRVRKLTVIGASDRFLIPMDTGPLIDALLSDPPTGSPSHITLNRLAHAPGNNMDALVRFLRHGTEFVTPDFLSWITMPTLAITGSEDALGDAGVLRSHMPDCNHVEIAGCDHYRLPSDPRTIEATLSFLRN